MVAWTYGAFLFFIRRGKQANCPETGADDPVCEIGITSLLRAYALRMEVLRERELRSRGIERFGDEMVFFIAYGCGSRGR